MTAKKKVITIAVTTVALSLGSIGIATATNSKSTVKVKSTVSNSISKSFGVNFRGHSGMVRQNGELAAVLSALVAKGTLTQAQVDAITAAITAAHNSRESAGEANHSAHLTLIASTIGIDVATLQKRLAAGESLATIAGAKKDALVLALVAQGTKEIDAAVAAGKITAAQAVTLKAGLTAQITMMINLVGGMQMGDGVGHMEMGRGSGDRDHNMMGAPRFKS